MKRRRTQSPKRSATGQKRLDSNEPQSGRIEATLGHAKDREKLDLPERESGRAAPVAIGYLGTVSLSLVSYQVIQTRLLSALFAYHYVFLVTSLAILGLGIGGLVVYLRPSLSRAFEQNPGSTMTRLSLALFAAYLLSFALVSFGPFWGSPLPYALILMMPELVGGAVLALLFQHNRDRMGTFYAADLGGAGLGCLLVVASLDHWGFIRTWVLVICISLACVLLVWPLAHAQRAIIRSVLGIAIIGFPFCISGALSHFEQQYPPALAAPGKLVYDMNQERGPGSLTVTYTRWDSFGRTDVIDITGEPDRKALTIDGVAYSGMFRFHDEYSQLAQYPDTAGYLPSIGNLPFVAAANDPVLLIGSGGGRDLLYALRSGAKDIDAVEINRAAIDAVRAFGEFNGHLYNRPEIRVFPSDGRLFIQSTSKRYELILMSLVKTEAATAAGMSLAENYIFTKEALSVFYDHLTDTGRIAFVVHHEAALSKIVATALEVLTDKGIAATDAPQHLAVIGSKNLDPVKEVFQPLVIIKKRSYSEAEALSLMGAAEQSQNPVAYVPHVREDSRLLEIHQGTRSIAAFAENLPYVAEPATDDCPYFYHFDSSTTEIFWYAAAAILILGAAVFLKPVAAARCQRSALLVSLMGVGFMLIEIPLVQKMGLYWGSSTRSFAVVLGTLLVSAGLGSYATSNRLVREKSGKYLTGALLVALVCGGLSVPLRHQIQAMATESAVLRVLITAALIAPLGFFMGMPFSQVVMRLKSSAESRTVPLLWAINGVASVLGATVAVVLSMSVGLSAVMGIGALAYLSLFVLSKVS